MVAMVAMGRGPGVLLALTTGCSLIGARVPDKPPPPEHCPEGVVMLDILGASITLAAAAGAVLLTDYDRDPGGLGAVIIGVPLAVIGLVYTGSAIYGTRAKRRCERMQEALAVKTEEPAATSPERAKVVGDKPMHCAITEADAGLCFTDEAACRAEAERAAVTCETRTSAYCFDVSHRVVTGRDTVCAVSPFDCDARRMLFTTDRAAIVTQCGPYVMAAPTN